MSWNCQDYCRIWLCDVTCSLLHVYADILYLVVVVLRQGEGCDQAKKNPLSSNATFIKQIRSNVNLILR